MTKIDAAGGRGDCGEVVIARKRKSAFNLASSRCSNYGIVNDIGAACCPCL
jgi:hypothetical protein